MKLVNNRYKQHMEFDKYSAYYLIVENPKEYLKVVGELYNECTNNVESDFILSDKGEILSISKNCLLLHNYFDLDVNNKKIINEINNRALNILSHNDYVEDIFKLNELFININDKIADAFDFELEYDSDLSYEKFIKMANFKISAQTTFLDRLLAYIKIYTSLKSTKLVVFVGLSAFLDKREIELVLRQLEYSELKCLFVEPVQKFKIENAGRILIDDDLCEI